MTCLYITNRKYSRSYRAPKEWLCRQKPIYRLNQLHSCFIEPPAVSQNSPMCQLYKRGTLDFNARQHGPKLSCRMAALYSFYRKVKIPQAPVNGSQVVFDPTNILEVDRGLGQLETLCRQQALKGHLESAPKSPYRSNVDFSLLVWIWKCCYGNLVNGDEVFKLAPVLCFKKEANNGISIHNGKRLWKVDEIVDELIIAQFWLTFGIGPTSHKPLCLQRTLGPAFALPWSYIWATANAATKVDICSKRRRDWL